MDLLFKKKKQKKVNDDISPFNVHFSDLHFKMVSSLQYNKVNKKQIQMLNKHFRTSITRTNGN